MPGTHAQNMHTDIMYIFVSPVFNEAEGLMRFHERLKAVVPLARLFLHEGNTPLVMLAADSLINVPVTEQQDRVTELFDKYNLLALPVVDDEGSLAGVITPNERLPRRPSARRPARPGGKIRPRSGSTRCRATASS